MKLTSPQFERNGRIPSKYTCEGEDINPPLMISDIPEGTKSLVLIMDDPDVPKHLREDGIWDHWIKFNIPPTTTTIAEGEEPEGVSGQGTSGNLKYHGPCPPDREHRYFFKLYALDTELALPGGASKKDVEVAMQNHILGEAVLIGLYEKGSK
jgi:hypothetical protein